MNTTGKAVSISACLLIAAIGFYSARGNHRATESARALLRQRNDAQNQLRTRIAFLRTQTETQKIRLAELTAASALNKSPQPSLPEASAGTGDRLAENPNLARLRTQFFAADATLSYGRFFHSLALSPAQLTQLGETIAGWEEWSQDHANQWPGNIPPSDPRFIEFQREIDEKGKKYKSDLIAILGSEGVESFSEFNATQDLWRQLGNLASAVYASDTPLTADQSTQLLQVMKKHTVSATAKSSNTIDVDAVVQEATPILSPLQLSVFTKQLTAGKLWDEL